MTESRHQKARDAKRSNEEGRNAEPGEPCPYHRGEMLGRCAWLAGHYDQHGIDAWRLSRVNKSVHRRVAFSEEQ